MARTTNKGKEGPADRAGPRLCLCGCGGTTKSTFVPGHDMRYKSALFAKALAGDADALATVEARGWSAILEAKRTKAQRKAVVESDRTSHLKPNGRTRPDEPALAALARINTMKAARARLQALGRYGRSSGGRRVVITAENAQSIVDGTHPELVGEEL